jgi:hypothetical protein
MNLKRYYHGLFQAENMMKTLQKQPDLIFNPNILQEISLKGYINVATHIITHH